jgi:lysophospholipase L1-like esterase
MGDDTARGGLVIEAGSTYVALGSSFAAGPGIEPILDKGAARSGRNYAHQVAAALSLRLVDVTSAGATTAEILFERQKTRRGHVPPQIQAVTGDTKLVTVTAGGNDIGYIGSLIKGSTVNAAVGGLRFLPSPLTDRLRHLVDFRAPHQGFDTVADSLVRVVEAVRARAPEARVVLVDYLTVLGTGARTGPAMPLGPDAVAQVTATADGLAEAFARAAERSGADLVTASSASVEHGVGSDEPWVTGFRLRHLFGSVPYHPTAAGMSAVAALVLGAASKSD